MGSVVKDVKARMKGIDQQLPAGYFVEIGGSYSQMTEAFGTLGWVFALALLLVYMVMASQFESFRDPFIIMFTIPLCFIGIVVGLLIAGRPINLPVWIGIILLAGVAVNNAIVMIDYMNQLRRSGVDKKEAIQKLALIVTYAMLINIFFVLMEVFTALYSSIPEHAEHFQYLYVGLEGHTELVRWMWTSTTLSLLAVLLLLSPGLRERPAVLGLACTIVIVAIWIEKGLAMVVAGFVPSPLGKVTAYTPTAPELLISLAVYGVGALILTLLYKIALSVRGELQS